MDEINALTPPLQQKIAILVLGLIAFIWIMHLVRYYRVREEHALLWFLGIVGGVFVVWCDPVLVAITAMLGVAMPASALLLLSLFFLGVMCVWITTIISTQKSQLAHLCIEISILKARLNNTIPTRNAPLATEHSSSGNH